MKKPKIAIIGSRGIPSKYGGFETFTEYLSVALVQKGYDVLVSCEYSFNEISTYKGVDLFYFPIKQPKSNILRIIYEFVYDFHSIFYASQQADLVYMLGYSASFFFFIPLLFHKKLIVNPDGIEWKRSKFNPFIQFLLKLSERTMLLWTKNIVADSSSIKNYFDRKYGINSYFIPYGVEEPSHVKWDFKKINNGFIDLITPDEYWLLVARLEPENNIHLIVEGYLKSKSTKPLVVVGDFSFQNYENMIKAKLNNIDKKIIFTGSIYNREILNMLRYNCLAYLHGHSVGGTNPSLLEAMIMKNLIVAHDNEFNREVCDEFALYFKDSCSLQNQLELIEENTNSYIIFREKIYQRGKKIYSWDKVFREYDHLFKKLLEALS